MVETSVWVRIGCTVKVQLPFDWEQEEGREEDLIDALKQAIAAGNFEPDGETYVVGNGNSYDEVEFDL